MKHSATAVWDGRVKDGHGELTTESGLIRNARYSYATRFGSQAGPNPEELLAAAHAAAFSMSLSNVLEKSHLAATHLEITASVRSTVTEVGDWAIREAGLFLRAHLDGAPSIPFLVAASKAKSSCTVSNLFSVRVTLHTELEGQRPGSDTELEVVIYTSSYRPVCGHAKTLLESRGIHYREVDLDQEPPDVTENLMKRTGCMSVPQIFVGEHFIGSYGDLLQLDADHGLQQLLQPIARTPAGPVGPEGAKGAPRLEATKQGYLDATQPPVGAGPRSVR